MIERKRIHKQIAALEKDGVFSEQIIIEIIDS